MTSLNIKNRLGDNWLIWLAAIRLKNAPASLGYVLSSAISAMASECGIKRLSVRNSSID